MSGNLLSALWIALNLGLGDASPAEKPFTLQTMPQKTKPVDTLPRVVRMILEELENMPEYDQLRLLAAIVEKRYKKLEGEIGGKG